MNLKTLPFVLIISTTFISCITSYARASEEDNNWHITARIGFSFSTGFIGAEAQKGNHAIAAGVIPLCYIKCNLDTTVAYNYYFNGIDTSWSIGIFDWRWDDNGSSDNFIGLGVQYRMRLGSRSDISLGLGTGKQTHNTSLEVVKPVKSITYGYMF